MVGWPMAALGWRPWRLPTTMRPCRCLLLSIRSALGCRFVWLFVTLPDPNP
jgi:hypothetical protein